MNRCGFLRLQERHTETQEYQTDPQGEYPADPVFRIICQKDHHAVGPKAEEQLAEVDDFQIWAPVKEISVKVVRPPATLLFVVGKAKSHGSWVWFLDLSVS